MAAHALGLFLAIFVLNYRDDLGYFLFRFKSLGWFGAILMHLSPPLYTGQLDAQLRALFHLI